MKNTAIRDFPAWANLLSALGNQHRLAIIHAIREREMNVGALCELTGLSQSAASQHLSKLRAAGLVKTRRDRQTIYSKGHSPEAGLILDALATLAQPSALFRQFESQ